VLGTELAPGLWRWTAFHPKWKKDVGSLAIETVDGLVLVDPLLDDGQEAPRPAHVLITVHWHVRSTAAIAERWPESRLWAPRRTGKPLRGHAEATDVYVPGDDLPGDVRTRPTARESEAVFWIPAHSALVVGDVLLGGKDGTLRMCPQRWLEHGATHDDLARSLRPLLDLPFDKVLVAHGDPVLENAQEAVAAALA
jgi:glyoxylase-like metal-dependent hydrolase (beta-lactamase superfamily II)